MHNDFRKEFVCTEARYGNKGLIECVTYEKADTEQQSKAPEAGQAQKASRTVAVADEAKAGQAGVPEASLGTDCDNASICRDVF